MEWENSIFLVSVGVALAKLRFLVSLFFFFWLSFSRFWIKKYPWWKLMEFYNVFYVVCVRTGRERIRQMIPVR